MENPIILNARLKMKRAAIETNLRSIGELEEHKNVILRAVDDAKTEEDVESASTDATETDEKIKALTEDVEKLKKDVADIEKQLKDNNDESGDDNSTDDTNEGDERNMGLKVINPEDKNEKAVRSLIDYLNSKGQKRAGIKTSDIGAIIPKQVIYEAEDEVNTTDNLSQYVDVITVNQSGGTWNVAKKVDESLHTVEELAANPELKNPELISVEWAVKTYRGAIESSNEAIQDAPELQRLIQKTLDSVVLNTKNRLITDVLKTATAKTANDTDGIKDIVNVDLDPAYNKMIIATQSGFNFLDKLKDNDGRYLMQPDVTSPTGYKLLGLTVATVSDTALGTKQGDAVAFIGDAKRFVKFFDRDEVQIGWATNENYAQQLLAALRADVKAADTAAGYLVKFAPKA